MNLQKLRKQKGISQSKLAKETGISIRTIQMYECGGRNIDGAGLDKLVKFSQALDCQITDLLTDEKLIEECKKVQL